MTLRSLTLFLFLVSAAVAFGQGSHYEFPFSIECPESLVSPGEIVSVNLRFPGPYTGEKYSPTYNWTVSRGEISGGQGTTSIKIDVGRSGSDSLIVTLERAFGQPHYPFAQRDGSCTIGIVPVPQARMIDEFRTAGNNCEEGFARLDAFFTELGNNPMDAGLIVINGDARDARAALRREQQLLNHFTFRKFDRSRVRIIRGAPRQAGTTQFWSVPPGADQPEISQDASSGVAEKPPPQQPYFYAADYLDGVPGCSGYLYDLEEYARVLNANPAKTGRIVISQSSRAKYARTLREILAELTQHGVARHRVTSIYKYVRPNRLLEVTELWVVPPRAKTK